MAAAFVSNGTLAAARHTLSPPRIPLCDYHPLHRPLPKRSCSARGRGAHVCKSQASSECPEANWEPDKDKDYAIVKVYSLSPMDRALGGRLLVLKPIRPSTHALKVSMTCAQADSIMSVLKKRNAKENTRPNSHDMMTAFIQSSKAKLLKVAITHTNGVLFYARVWMRVQDNEVVHLDARPSDALALAVRCKAPIYMNMRLLGEWGTPMKVVEKEVERGLYDRLQSIYVAMDDKYANNTPPKETLKLKFEKKKMELQLAVRLQRYNDAARMRDELRELCPIDQLRIDLEEAVREQRYLEAAKIRDQIFDWDLKFFLWRIDEMRELQRRFQEQGYLEGGPNNVSGGSGI